MISDQETNFVYFSNLSKLDFGLEVIELIRILDDHEVGHSFLKYTKDYFCRDYMPIQVEKEQFIQFKFDPRSYLKPQEFKFISNPQLVLEKNHLPAAEPNNLIVDGGNVVKSKSKVILTDKIFKDNSEFSKIEVIDNLTNALRAEIIIIPQYPGEKTGHADGMVRFINENTVVINDLGDEQNTTWKNEFIQSLERQQINYRQLPILNAKDDSAFGLYINYLHVGDLIVLPDFGHDKDDEAEEVMAKLFPDQNIKSVNASKIAKEGGVLNCATWNIIK